VITRSLPLPENVKWLSETEPETFVLELEDLPVAIHGQSFARGAISANLAAGYPSPLPGCFNIGMLHTSLDGRAGHDTYAPCSLRDLQSKGYDYWALGHVHSREVMSEDPWIVFSGNTQGRHVREGGAKGCTLVTVEGGRVEGVEPRELDVLRWAVCTVDVSGLHTSSEVVDRAVGVIEEQMAQNDGYEMAIRLELTGPCEAHNSIAGDLEQTRSDLRATVTDVSGGLIWIEDVRLRTEPPSRLTKEQTDALSRLTLAVEDLDVKDLVEASALWQRLPQQLRNNPDSFDFEELKKLAQAELVERLRREGSQR
jgi:DNA repair exonuclease SbcCD nuclease subunit